jgi:hypothetical protein
MEHSCKATHEEALIAHRWRANEDGSWVRDDCAEQGVAMAALIVQLPNGSWTGPESGPNGEAALYETVDEARKAFDAWLKKRGWKLLDVPADLYRHAS